MANWTIQNLIRHANDGGVVVVFWKASIQEDYTAGSDTHRIAPEQTGHCEFVPDSSADGFIPFDDLTESGVLAWVFGVIDKDSIEQDLQNRLDAKKASISKFINGMPWGTP